MPFLTAVAVFAVGVGGFVAGVGAFAVFAATLGGIVFLLAFLGGSAAQGWTRGLRTWGRRLQSSAGIVILLVGIALIYSGVDPGVYRSLILSG